MRNLTLRLIIISGFLLLSYATSLAQCPDTQPVVIGPDVVRAGQTVNYSTYAIPGHTYSWSLSGGGSIVGSSTSNQVTIAWGNNPTTATVTISESNSAVPGCTPIQASKTVTLQPLLHAYFYYQFDPTGGCYYNVVNFTADPNVSVHPNDPSVTYTWNFGDGTGYHTTTASYTNNFPITGIYLPPHTFPVTLIIQNPAGQKDSITDYVYVDPDKFKPTADITTVTLPTPNCLYNAVTFSASGSLPKPPSNPDNSIKIKYCDWYVNDVLFHHSGDGIIIPCDMTAQYTFTAPGTYNIKLTVTNTINCTNTTTKQVTIDNTVPVALFTFTQSCVNEITPFTDQSLANTGTITDWWWSWGDGSPNEHYNSTTNPPPVPVPHIFTDQLSHQVTLRVMNSNGCEHTSQPVTVQAAPSPRADFAYPTVTCQSYPVQFTDLSSPLNGSPIVSWLWNFDDPLSPNPTSTDQNPEHLFSGSGSYHVTLTVTNQNGCANTKILSPNALIVHANPYIDFTSTLGASPYLVNFHQLLNPNDSVGNNLHWLFGDGTEHFGSDPTHTYPGPGTFTVTCIATSMSTGCHDSIQHNVTVGSPPSAFFSANPQQQCQNDTILFIPGPPGGFIQTEDWDFGDGSPPLHFDFPNTPASPIHVYALTGPFQVTRILNQGTAMEASWTVWVTIYPSPTSHFTWYSDQAHLHQWKACDGQPVYFVDESYSNSSPPGSIYQWLWNFDDPMAGPNNTSALQNPVHTFLSAKTTFYVKLIVWDNLHSCQSVVDTQIVTINPPIPVEFSYNNNVCQDHLVNFTTDPVTLPPTAYTWLWEFGDGGTSTTPGNVSHWYATVGNFTVTLTLTDTLGCSKSKQHVVSIIPKPIANFTFTSPTCFGQVVQFTDLSTVPLPYNDIVVAWDWDFGDGSAHSNLQNPSHLYTVYSATGYNVILTVTTNRGCTDSKTINVQQVASPAADFDIMPGTYSCVSPQTVHFKDLSQTNGGGSLTSWSWNFGDPASGATNFSNAQNPSHIFNTAGTYTVTMIVFNTSNCSDTIQKDITVNALPAPDFTFTTPCLGNNTLFADATLPNAPGILSWAWDFGDGGTSPLQNPQHLFVTAGTHQVTLVVVNSNGCTNTVTKAVTVNPKPIVDFIHTSPFCQHTQITFTSQAYVPAGFTSYINSWIWRFGDGTPDGSGPVVTHTYTDVPPSHTVTLITTTTDGCTDSISKVVTGIPSPLADFTFIGITCQNQPVSFIDNSQTNGGGTITQWLWNFDDPGSGSQNTSTLQSPTHSFFSTGVHHVTLLVTNVNGCTDQKQIDVTINEKPVAAFTAANACLGNLTQFTDGSTTPSGTIVAWAWDFGDGGISSAQNPMYLFTTSGIHYVTLTVTNSNGCIQSITHPVEVYPHPVTAFSFSSPTCAGGTVTFTDMSTTGHGYIYRRYWDFGDGNFMNSFVPTVTHTYNTGGNYVVKLTVTTSDSCTGEKTITVPIQFAPIADFVVTNPQCVLMPVQFTDNSQVNGGSPITQWQWNFGDPGSGSQNNSNQQNPQHSFSAAGSFWVHLTVTNADGCIGRDSMQIAISLNPIADFTATNACQGDATTFTDNSVAGSGSIVTWLWNFGDGGVSNAQNPTYTYTVGGTYSVTLTVTNSNGCVNTKTKPVNVWPTPNVLFSQTSPTCAGSSVTFTDLSTTSHGYIVLRQWAFGDATFGSSAGPTITHTYATGGTFNVTLTVTTSDSCHGTHMQPVQIQYNPISDFTWQNTGNCVLEPVQFTDQSQQNGGGQITQWHWLFGDPNSGGNNVSYQQNPVHSFTASGTFQVQLTVTNASGCSKDTTIAVSIADNPTADFTNDTVCKGSATSFTDNSSGGTFISWAWNFGDGGSSNVQNPTHTYANPGTYQVSLLVTTDLGCHGTVTKTVHVWPKPVAQFTFENPVCSSDSIQFTDLSTTGHGTIRKWTWNFGDGSSQSIDFPASPNVKHKYSTGGTYNVTLTVRTSDSCQASITTQVPIEYEPVANFSHDAGACALMPNQFTDLSQANGGTAIVAWLWDFGDPASGAQNTSTLKDPTHAFTSGGNFTVLLKVTNATGCWDTVSNTIAVNAAPLAAFTADTACVQALTQFTDNSTSPGGGTINAWLWNFGDPASGANNVSTLQNPTHIYNSPGNYMVTLQVTNTNNCTNDTVQEISVNPKPLALFEYTAACALDSTIFTDLSIAPGSQLIAWHWNFGDGGTSDVQNPKHKYAAAGTYTVVETVTNLSGCQDSVSIPVEVYPKPTAAFEYMNKFCPKGEVNFQDKSTAPGATIVDRLWTFEPGQNSTAPNPTYTFSVYDTTYVVSLEVTDSHGCKDTVYDSVYVKPAFKFTFVHDTVCFGYTMHFHPVDQAQGDSLYSPFWEFGDPNSGPNNYSHTFNTTHTFTAPGLFYVKLRLFNSDNCVDSVFKTVQVYALPEPHFSANISQCDSVMHFHDTTSVFGTGTIAQWEWKFGDGSPSVIIPSPGPGDTSHIYNAIGAYQATLIITNTNGCVDSITQEVRRLPCIKADYNYADTLRCMNYPIAFHDTSVPVNLIRNWRWSWGDGTPDTSYTSYANVVHHTFTTAGTYYVKLRITALVSAINVYDSMTQQVVIHPTPKTMFSNVPVCLHQPVIFRDTSITYGEAVSKWAWNFGEPSSGTNDTSSLKNPIHTYATRDTFQVKLITMNRFGCKDSLTKPMRVFGLPVANFAYTPPCSGDPTQFRDTTSIADTTIGYWKWKFGDPLAIIDSSMLKDPEHKYKTPGNYLVRLIVRDHFGCRDTIDSTVTVHVTPVAAFTVYNGYDGTPGKVKLNNQSSGANWYDWDFGNGKSSNDTNPVATYTEDGTYTIQLISRNTYGCTDTTYYEYKILFRGLFIPNAFAPNSGNLSVRLFKPVGMNLKTYHIMVFDSWGHLLWESNKLDSNGVPVEGWDGTFDGSLMPQGNYFWKATATFIDDAPWTGSDTGVKGSGGTMGSFMLIR